MRQLIITLALGVFIAFAASVSAQENDAAAARVAEWMQRLAPNPGAIEPFTHECLFHTNLSCNTNVSDTVNIFGCRTDNFEYFNMHRFFVDANTKVTLTMRSFSFSSLLLL